MVKNENNERCEILKVGDREGLFHTLICTKYIIYWINSNDSEFKEDSLVWN